MPLRTPPVRRISSKEEAMDSTEHEATWELEAVLFKPGSAGGGLSKDMRNGHCRTAHNMSSSSLRKKSDLSLLSKIRCGALRNFMANLHEIFLGTKLFVLFPAVPLAMAAQNYGFGRVSLCLFFLFLSALNSHLMHLFFPYRKSFLSNYLEIVLTYSLFLYVIFFINIRCLF